MSTYGDALERQAATYRALQAEYEAAEKAYYKARDVKEEANKKFNEAWGYLHTLLQKAPK